MRAYVYTDKALGRYAGRFVWLSINTEDKKNAAFLQRYPIPVLPTLLVLDPKHDDVALRYVGGATVSQLTKLLDESETKVSSRSRSEADALLLKADRAAAAGREEESAKLFEQAIAAAPKGWKNFGRAAESLMFAISSGDAERCASRALALHPRVAGSVAGANVGVTGLSCAMRLPKEHAKRAAWIADLEKKTRTALDDRKVSISDDDRSGLYMTLIEAREEQGDEAGAKTLSAEWTAFLEKAAADANTPEKRTVYDSHRLSAYLAAGTPEKAIPMLEQSERDFPDDYNAPSRLAAVYRALKRYDEAIAASDRALLHVDGPRRLTVLSARADIFVAKGDPKAAKDTLAEAIEYAKALPAGQRSDRRIAALEKKLAGIQ